MTDGKGYENQLSNIVFQRQAPSPSGIPPAKPPIQTLIGSAAHVRRRFLIYQTPALTTLPRAKRLYRDIGRNDNQKEGERGGEQAPREIARMDRDANIPSAQHSAATTMR